MKMGKWILVVLMIGLVPSAFAATETQTFDSEASAAAAGWVGIRNTEKGSDFGWRDSSYASGVGGEAGGFLTRTTDMQYYVDATLGVGGSLTQNDAFTATGELYLADPGTKSTAFFIAYGNTETTNSLGLVFSRRNSDNFDAWVFIQTPEHGYQEQKLPGNKPYRGKPTPSDYQFEISYNGAHNLYVAIYDGGSLYDDISMDMDTDNTFNLNCFGLINRNMSSDASDRRQEVYIDDLEYTVPEPPTIPVNFNIKPGSCPNPLNVKSRGVIPAAILGTEDFDVNMIDAVSVRLNGVAPIRHNYEDVATPVVDGNECECNTDGPDGYLDLTLKFDNQEVVDTLPDVNNGDVLVFTVQGALIDEMLIEGTDCVKIVGAHKPLNMADINKDGKVDMADLAIFSKNWLESSIIEE